MSSLRHIDRQDGDPRLDAYLDAARDCILDVGWRRTTLTEVAKRAGVSRMTIYRAWSDMGSLLGDLMTREWVDIAAATRVAAVDTTTPAGHRRPPRSRSCARCATTSSSSGSSSSTPT